MTRFVLDASVSLRWFLDTAVPVYARRVKQLMLDGSRALVPALWHLEMANGVIAGERRGILTASDADRCLTNLEQLLALAVDTESAPLSARAAFALARSFKLSAYDAAYLELARRERLPVATLDEHLKAAAPEAGVSVLR